MSHFEQSVFICIRSFQILLKYSLIALLPSLLCYIWFKWAERYTTSCNTVLNPLKETAFLILEISVKCTMSDVFLHLLYYRIVHCVWYYLINMKRENPKFNWFTTLTELQLPLIIWSWGKNTLPIQYPFYSLK